MKAGKEICVLCAWRENCNKKFSISWRDVRCPAFVKDLSIKEEMPFDSKGHREVKSNFFNKSFAAEAVSG